MRYDKKLLRRWARMPTWDRYVEENGGLGQYSSREGFDHLQRMYFALVEKRIDCCKNLLEHHQDAFLYYVIGELYDRGDLNRSPACLYKRPVRYFALKALEFDPSFTPAKKLLDRADEWVQFLGGDGEETLDFDVQFKDNVEQKEF